MINASQIRAARALLDWSRDQLASACGVSIPALANIETAKSNPHSETIAKVQSALEQAGILFTDNSGVKLKSDIVQVFEGTEGMKAFADDLYFHASKYGGEFLISGGNQSDFFDAIGPDYLAMHAQRISQVKNFSIRALKPASRPEESGLDYITFRWIPDQMFFSVPFYVYHDKLAIISFNPSRVVILNDKRIAAAYATQFEIFWKLGKKKGDL